MVIFIIVISILIIRHYWKLKNASMRSHREQRRLRENGSNTGQNNLNDQHTFMGNLKAIGQTMGILKEQISKESIRLPNIPNSDDDRFS